MATHTLFMTSQEEEALRARWQGLCGDCDVVHEETSGTDSPARMQARFRLLHVSNPTLQQFADRASALDDMGDLLNLIDRAQFDMTKDDVTELCFVLGPVLLGSLVAELLAGTPENEALGLIEALTQIRHAHIEAQNLPHPAQ